MKEKISETQDNLDMSTTIERDLLTQITSTIKHLEDTNKILMEEVKTLIATNARL